MPRRGSIPKRAILPDPIYQSPLVTRFINCSTHRRRTMAEWGGQRIGWSGLWGAPMDPANPQRDNGASRSFGGVALMLRKQIPAKAMEIPEELKTWHTAGRFGAWRIAVAGGTKIISVVVVYAHAASIQEAPG